MKPPHQRSGTDRAGSSSRSAGPGRGQFSQGKEFASPRGGAAARPEGGKPGGKAGGGRPGGKPFAKSAPGERAGWGERREERPPGKRNERPPAAPARPAPEGRAPSWPQPVRPPEPPRGALWLSGLHAVAAALANPARRLRRLLLTEEAEATLSGRLPPPWPLAPERTERARLDQLLGPDAVHQGVALLADPLAPPPLAQVLERGGPVLVLDQVADPRNIGAILRAAAAFAVCGVIVQERHAPSETGAMARAAAGALETIPILRAVNIARTLVALKAAGFWVVGLDAGGAALSGPALGGRRVALVLGGEGAGLRRLTRETCDDIAGLPMPGKMESLNVSAAAAVALYEISRGVQTRN